ncbi:MAG: hypothetical protein ACXVRU_14065 [Gaiellaceae bacterium]
MFRTFERDEFLEWQPWERVRDHLHSNGGSYGVSGPRGAGKSWLMLRAIDEVRAPAGRRGRGIGLWYPTPSEYNPLSFLATLSDALVNEIERRFRPRSAVTRAVWSGWTSVVIAILVAILVLRNDSGGLTPGAWVRDLRGSRLLLSGGGAGQRVPGGINFVELSKIILWVALALLAWWLVLAVVRSTRPQAGLLKEGAIVRARARYTATLREASEVGAEAAHGVAGRWRKSKERELVERPWSISSLVNDFRSLAEHAGQVTGSVVIGIDELDKMDDPTKVKDLLRDIKGIFDVPQVYFFVSVSDEAARSLNLGALTGRDEFNSSFYTVIELPPMSPSQCVDLLRKRGPVEDDVAHRLAVLAGGNPRDVVRLAESDAVAAGVTSEDAVKNILKEEALNLRRQIVTATAVRPPIGDDARIGAFRSLPDDAFEDLAAFTPFAASALTDEMWLPTWADGGWNSAFGEAWRRLLIRLIVGARLVEGSLEDKDLLQLRDVVIAATESAAVARIVFEERLRLENPAAA